MSLWLTLVLQVLPEVAPFDLASVSRTIPALDRRLAIRCDGRAAQDEIVVCGTDRERHRLPLPTEQPARDRVLGEARTGMDALTPPTRCGIFAGERQCGKREAAEYGYGNGRDPITVLGRLAGKIVDPDGN